MNRKFYQYITGFNGGLQDELSYSRIDMAQQRTGCRTVDNFLIFPQGPVIKRSGSIKVAERIKTGPIQFVKYSGTDGKDFLLAFEDSIVSFYSQYNPIYNTTNLVTNGDFPSNITGWTNASTGSSSIAWDGTNARMNLVGAASSIAKAQQTLTCFANSRSLRLTVSVFTNPVTVKVGTTAGASDLYYTILQPGNAQLIQVDKGSGTSIYLEFSNPNNNTAAVDGITVVQNYTLATSFDSTMVGKLQYAIKADNLIFTNQAIQPKLLTRTTDTSWAFTDLTFNDGPYHDEKEYAYGGKGTKITASPGSTSIATSTTVTFASALPVTFPSGSWLRARDVITNSWGSGRIVTSNSTTPTVSTSLPNSNPFPATTASYLWRASYIGNTGPWPASVTIFEDRVIYGNFSGYPNAIFASVSGTLDVFSPDADYADTITGSTAINMSVPKGKLNWLSPTQYLFAGSSADLYSISGGSAGLSAETAHCRETAAASTSNVLPVGAQSTIIFANGFKNQLVSVAYSNLQETFIPEVLSNPIQRLLYQGINEVSYQEAPIPIVWVRTVDNKLLGLTYIKDEKVKAWHSHTLAGALSVDAIATLRGSTQDNLWVATSRDVNGTTKYFIEYLDDIFIGKAKETGHFSDCGIKYSGPATTIVGGLLHLRGKEVDIFADGGVVPKQTVAADGTITLQNAATKVNIGLPYISTLIPNVQEGGNPLGSSQLLTQSTSSIKIRVIDSMHFRIGVNRSDSNFDSVVMNNEQVLGQSPSLYTGPVRTTVKSGPSIDPSLQIISDTPTPLSISSIALTLEITGM